MYGPVASAFTGAGSVVSKEAATYAWNFVENFQKYDAADEDLSDSSSTPNVTYKQFLSTLRTFDPDVTYEQIAWVLGKEEARANNLVTFNEIWQNLDDGDLDKLDVDPLEQSFARLVDQNQEYLDLQKVGNALQSAGIHGVTEDIMEKCTRRIRELARENVRDARGKKKDDIDFRDYRRLFAMTEGIKEQETRL